MIKANQFQTLTNKAKEQQLQKQKRIQLDMKLAEDSLNDLYIKVQKNIDLGVNPPKYIEIPKLLEKEVQDNLIIEQNYFLDIIKNGHTRIYYDKNDFENRITDNENKILHKASEEFKNMSKTELSKKESKEDIKPNYNNTFNISIDENMSKDTFDELIKRLGTITMLKNRGR